MSNSFYHKDLTDAQWNRIKFIFEKPEKVGRPSLNPRTVFNAILWILKSGARWRDLPAHYGNWNSIYHKFRRRCSLDLFDRLLKVINADVKDATLLDAAARIPKFTSLSTKLTGGNIHDSEPALALLSGVELGGKKILADKAYRLPSRCHALQQISSLL